VKEVLKKGTYHLVDFEGNSLVEPRNGLYLKKYYSYVGRLGSLLVHMYSSYTIGFLSFCFMDVVITKISSAHGYKNSASSNSNEVIHGPKLIPHHSKKVKNYTK
jgi:hypothetical protein